MTLNYEKCHLAQESVKFLGHVVDSSGIRLDPSKVSPSQNVLVPTSVGEMYHFLSMVNQLNKFSPTLLKRVTHSENFSSTKTHGYGESLNKECSLRSRKSSPLAPFLLCLTLTCQLLFLQMHRPLDWELYYCTSSQEESSSQ